MKFSEYAKKNIEKQLKEIIKGAINHYARDYLNLKHFAKFAPTEIDNIFNKNKTDGTADTALLKSQGIIIRNIYGKYTIGIVNDALTSISNHLENIATKSNDFRKPSEFTDAEVSRIIAADDDLQPRTKSPPIDLTFLEGLVELARSQKKYFSIEQLNKINKKAYTCSSGVVKEMLLHSESDLKHNPHHSKESLKQFITEYDDGILSLRQLINHIKNNAIPGSESNAATLTYSLLCKILTAVQFAHSETIAHNSINLDNIAIDLNDNHEIVIFLKNFYFSEIEKSSLDAAFDLKYLDIDPEKFYQQDCDDLATVIQQVAYQCDDLCELHDRVKANPKTEYAECTRLLTAGPKNIEPAIQILEDKITALLEFSRQKEHIKRDAKMGAAMKEQCFATIDEAKKTVRASPTLGDAHVTTKVRLNKKKTPPPLLSFFSLGMGKKELPAAVKDDILNNLSPPAPTKTKKKLPKGPDSGFKKTS